MARTLEQLRAECMQCRRCGLCETRHNVVFGAGPDDAEVMFIGEGPRLRPAACPLLPAAVRQAGARLP